MYKQSIIATSVSSIKMQSFALGFASSLLIVLLMKFNLNQFSPGFRLDLWCAAACFSIAYVAERIAQMRSGVKFSFFGHGRRHVMKFLIYISLWIASLWVASIDSMGQPGVLGFFSKTLVVYMFSAAFWEILNLIKVGSKS